jgi:hypothetical protein
MYQIHVSGAIASLPWFAVAVYDLIMGAQTLTEDYKTVQQGLRLVLKYFPNEYYDTTRLSLAASLEPLGASGLGLDSLNIRERSQSPLAFLTHS